MLQIYRKDLKCLSFHRFFVRAKLKMADWINKKSSYEFRNCLTFLVDQPGLEPGTSRLWVGKIDISWAFVLTKVYWYSIIYIFVLFIETLKIPLTQIVCLRIVYAEKHQTTISKALQNRPNLSFSVYANSLRKQIL